MREPPSKLPNHPDGLDDNRRILAECEAMLARPHISPEMKDGLRQRIAQLLADAEVDAAHRARESALDDADPAPVRKPRR